MPAPDFWWATPLVGLFGALVAVGAIVANRRTIKMRATLDLVERVESSDHYRKLFESFRELGYNNAIVSRVKDPETENDKKLRNDILAYLNHYELIALGCSVGILDEKFYYKWMRAQVVRDWHNAKEYIFFRRDPTTPKASPKAFVEFESLARRFENRPGRGVRFQRFQGLAQQLFRLWHR